MTRAGKRHHEAPETLSAVNHVDAAHRARHHVRMDDLFRLPGAQRDDPAVAAWFDAADPFRALAQPWFAQMRACGADVRETLHDHAPTACIDDVAFGYVNAFKAHASVGFFHGADLPDPARLLEGSGKRMRHLKMRAGVEFDDEALRVLIVAAADDVRRRLRAV